MLRKRSSIKGIGGSIFYDVEDPVFNPKLRNGKTGGGYHDLEVGDSASEDTSSPAQGQFYDTGELIALLESQARHDGNNHRRKAGREDDASIDRDSTEQLQASSIGVMGEPAYRRQGGTEATADSEAQELPWDESTMDSVPFLSEMASAEEPVPPAVDAKQPDTPAVPYQPAKPEERPVGQPARANTPIGDLKALTPEQEERARKRLGEQAFANLLQQTDRLYEQVSTSLSTREELARESMDLLSEARDLLLLGDASDFNLAERRVNEVRMTLSRVQQTRRWSNTYGWGLFIYEMALFVVFVVALLFDQHIAEWISLMTGTYTVVNGVAELTKTMSAIFPPWNTMLWGGIGGVVGALYSLHWHVAELQDFDKQYSLWYVVQPLMGLILGGIIHLVIVTGLLALIPVSDPSAGPAIAVQWFPALVACLAGFRQKFTYELLDNVMKALGRQPAQA